jgi:hypothetical protein
MAVTGTGLTGLLLGGCAVLAPREIRISQEELLTAVARQFPARRQVAQVLEVAFDRPRLRLQPDRDRVDIAMDLSVTNGLLNRSLDGSVAFSAGLRYDAAGQAVRLKSVRTESLRIDGLPQGLADLMQQWGGWLAEQLLEGAPVRRLQPQEVDRLRRAGLRPGDLRVAADGVVLTLQPLDAKEP